MLKVRTLGKGNGSQGAGNGGKETSASSWKRNILNYNSFQVGESPKANVIADQKRYKKEAREHAVVCSSSRILS